MCVSLPLVCLCVSVCVRESLYVMNKSVVCMRLRIRVCMSVITIYTFVVVRLCVFECALEYILCVSIFIMCTIAGCTCTRACVCTYVRYCVLVVYMHVCHDYVHLVCFRDYVCECICPCV